MNTSSYKVAKTTSWLIVPIKLFVVVRRTKYAQKNIYVRALM